MTRCIETRRTKSIARSPLRVANSSPPFEKGARVVNVFTLFRTRRLSLLLHEPPLLSLRAILPIHALFWRRTSPGVSTSRVVQ